MKKKSRNACQKKSQRDNNAKDMKDVKKEKKSENKDDRIPRNSK